MVIILRFSTLLFFSILVVSCAKPRSQSSNFPKEEVVLVEKGEANKISNFTSIAAESADVDVSKTVDPAEDIIIQLIRPSTLEIFQGTDGPEYIPTIEELDSGRLQSSVFLRSQGIEPTIYFRFNQSTLTPVRKIALQAHLNLLNKNKNAKIILEGHTDERGTSQYNLSLGLQRAIAIQSYLLDNNIDRKRIEIKTLGEERPALEGHQESHWRYNRRVEIYYQ